MMRATLIYQHATKDADQRIADALSARVEAERKRLGRMANGPSMARTPRHKIIGGVFTWWSLGDSTS
jgi:hypothetical protein